MLHGCLPVVIMDDVDPVFSSVLDWDSFSVRIPEVSSPTSASHGCSQAAVVKSCGVSLRSLTEASGWPHDWRLHQADLTRCMPCQQGVRVKSLAQQRSETAFILMSNPATHDDR